MKRSLAVVGLAAAATALAGCGSTPSPFKRNPARLVAAPTTCTPKRFDVYFAENQATLTPPALQALSLVSTQLQPCGIRSVRVTGLADARGTPAANQSLAERRANAVTEAMASLGWPTPVFEVQAGTSTEAEVLQRRTEIIIDAGPR